MCVIRLDIKAPQSLNMYSITMIFDKKYHMQHRNAFVKCCRRQYRFRYSSETHTYYVRPIGLNFGSYDQVPTRINSFNKRLYVSYDFIFNPSECYNIHSIALIFVTRCIRQIS